MYGTTNKRRRTAGLALLLAGTLLMGATFPSPPDPSGPEAAQAEGHTVEATVDGVLADPDDTPQPERRAFSFFGVRSATPFNAEEEVEETEGQDVTDQIDLTYLEVRAGGTQIYQYSNGDKPVIPPNVTLSPDTQLDFYLQWAPKTERRFYRGDYFTVSILSSPNLELPEIVKQPIDLITKKNYNIGQGTFHYKENKLTYAVEFQNDVILYQSIKGGTASGWISFSEEEDKIEIAFQEDEEQTYQIVKPEVTPPSIPGPATDLAKGLFSPQVSSGNTIPLPDLVTSVPGGEKGHGFDWRLTFLGLANTLKGETSTKKPVVLYDTISSNQSFSNYKSWDGPMNAGFFDSAAPFFLEIPLYSIEDGRILNYESGSYASPEQKEGYIQAIIPANKFKYIESKSAETVETTPLSWTIHKVRDNDGNLCEQLVLNLGTMGKGGELNSSLIDGMERQLVDIVDNKVVKQALLAKQQLGINDVKENVAAKAAWETVLVNNLTTLIRYWPDYKGEINKSLGNDSISKTDPVEFAKALSEKSQEQLKSAIQNIGSNNREITKTMPIDGLILRYRTMTDKDSLGSRVTNSAEVKTDANFPTVSNNYQYDVKADGDGELLTCIVNFVKVDAKENITGKLTKETYDSVKTGLSQGVSFQVYEKSDSGSPDKLLSFTESGGSHSYRISDTGLSTLSPGPDGKFSLKFTENEIDKKYYLVETKFGDGYYHNSSPYNFSPSYRQGEEIRYYAVPNISRSVRLIKVDQNNNATKLKGAQFQLFQESGSSPLPVTGEDGAYTYDKEGSVKTLVTDESGALLVTGLAAGTYEFREVKAPDGYQLSNTIYLFTLEKELPAGQNQDQVVVITAKNRKIDAVPGEDEKDLPVIKVDAKTNDKLKGATFHLALPNRTGQIKTTDNTGVATFYLPTEGYVGEYLLTERTAPSGYTAIGDKVRFQLDENYKITLSDSPAHVSIENGQLALVVKNDKNPTTSKPDPSKPDPSKPDPSRPDPSRPGPSVPSGDRDSGSTSRDRDPSRTVSRSTSRDTDNSSTIPHKKQTVIPSEEVPLTSLPSVTFSEEPVPLGGSPQTGASRTGLHLAAALLTVSGLALLLSSRKKKPDKKSRR